MICNTYLQQVKQRFKERQELHQQELDLQNKIDSEETDSLDSKSYTTSSSKSINDKRKKKSQSEANDMELSSFYDAIDIQQNT